MSSAPDPVASTEPAGSPDTGEDTVGWRAARTRAAIADGARKLFLERGYGGTRINNITDACGISRAGFYTYFKDKRAVFNYIGEAAYRGLLAVVGEWDTLPDPVSADDLRAWVGHYFDFMHMHGAFVVSSTLSAPTDADFRESAKRMQTRIGWLLGTALRLRQRNPTSSPETLGLAVVGMIERAWFHACAQDLGVDPDEMINTLTEIVAATLG